MINVLGLVDFLTEKGLNIKKEWDTGFRFIKNDKSPCLIVLMQNGEGWFICDVHEGGACGCGSEPGINSTIFEKNYENTCTSQIQLINPDASVINKFKEIIEWWLVNIGA